MLVVVRGAAGRLGRHEVGAGVVAIAQQVAARAVGADQGDAGAPSGRVVVEGEAQPIRVVDPRDQPARVARERDAVAVAVLDRGQAPDPARLAGESPEQTVVLEQQGVEVGKRQGEVLVGVVGRPDVRERRGPGEPDALVHNLQVDEFDFKNIKGL